MLHFSCGSAVTNKMVLNAPRSCAIGTLTIWLPGLPKLHGGSSKGMMMGKSVATVAVAFAAMTCAAVTWTGSVALAQNYPIAGPAPAYPDGRTPQPYPAYPSSYGAPAPDDVADDEDVPPNGASASAVPQV